MENFDLEIRELGAEKRLLEAVSFVIGAGHLGADLEGLLDKLL
jgi:hypothetical protein